MVFFEGGFFFDDFDGIFCGFRFAAAQSIASCAMDMPMTVLSLALVLARHPLRKSFASLALDRSMTLLFMDPFTRLPLRSPLRSLQWTCLWLCLSWASVPVWHPLRNPVLCLHWTEVSDFLVTVLADMCLLRSQLSSCNSCLTPHGWV